MSIEKPKHSHTTKKCPHCGASMKAHSHGLSRGLANTLIKFRKAVLNQPHIQFNKVHIPNDVVFTKNEYNNFQKLRYFGLVAKVRKSDGTHERGFWLLTRNGNAFCKGLKDMPKSVLTFRNKIQDRSKVKISILEAIQCKDLPYFEKDFAYELVDIIDPDVLPSIGEDNAGQTFFSFES